MNTITIDCGASFVKGALFVDGVILKRSDKKTPPVDQKKSIKEPLQINNILNVVKDLINELSSDIDSFNLCISNEMHGFVLVDKNINPIIDYVSWQLEYGNIVIDGISSKELLNKERTKDIDDSGMPIRAGLPSSNLFYLVRSKIVDVNNSIFLTLGDYVISKLSGSIQHCHPTNAAASGLYSLKKNDWNTDYIKYIVGDNNVAFPKIGNKTAFFVYNDKKVTCFAAIGDQQAALLGSGFIKKGQLSFNLGTGAQISILTTDYRDFNHASNYQIRPYFSGMYLKTIPHIPSGRASNVFVRFYKSVLSTFGIDVSDDVIWEKILSANGKERMDVSLSFFENAVDKDVCGYIKNISEYGLTFDNLSASFIDQLADNFITVSKKLTTKENVKEVVFSGGVSRKIKRVRDIILKEYNVQYIVAENETLTGLYNYSLM